MSKTALPGERIASIEEYESGAGTFDDGEAVRSSLAGSVEIDGEARSISVKSGRLLSVPSPGDIVIGTVAASMASTIPVYIEYINGEPVTSHVECSCSIRNIRRKNIALLNDVVKVKIIKSLNGAIHATMNEPELGVLFTKCRKCGGRVVPIRDAIKCVDCAWIDERKLARDFGKSGFAQIERS